MSSFILEHKHQSENRSLIPRQENQVKTKKKTINQNIFLDSNVFTLIDQKNESNSIESESPFADRNKEIEKNHQFITDEDVTQRKNEENRKKKEKKKGKKLNKKKENAKKNEREKEEEEKFRKLIENFAKKPCNIPSRYFLFFSLF